MAIPDYQSLMMPLLQIAADGHEHSLRETVEQLASQFRLTTEERAQPLPSRGQPIFENRVGWARTYLVKAGLLESLRMSLDGASTAMSRARQLSTVCFL